MTARDWIFIIAGDIVIGLLLIWFDSCEHKVKRKEERLFDWRDSVLMESKKLDLKRQSLEVEHDSLIVEILKATRKNVHK